MKRILKVLLVIVIVIAVVIGGGIFFITRGLDSGARLAINPVDISGLADGNYSGIYNSGRFSNELKVAVKDQKIVSIDVVKDVSFPDAELTDKLFKEVITKQNTDVDVVSSGTVTSKAYLKSIENALSK